ncbi:oligosaccharide repeat unit polymerase [Synechococcus elongatus]|uniref:Oligosaccharide repeat unit polymerase n=1 Tax=Synechococcus elongatus PCC 11802 TaxID=2283154 RepID=A0AAT9JVW0_SYNEL|nr:oligosaccharide repeat unit polymerase [Synechococcus elongatus]QFZ91314.1 oligosaccharide repeat unit polymerase [Synechococcus elongatus PCC 11802]
MTDPAQLSPTEWTWLSILLGLMVLAISAVWRSRNPLAWFQPPLVMLVIYGYYTVLGPLNALNEGRWVDRGVNLRYGMEAAWMGAAIAFAGYLIGYWLWPQKVRPPRRTSGFNPAQAWRLGQRLNWVGLILFGSISGSRLLVYLNPLTARQATALTADGLDFGAFANYASLAINLLIPGILLMTAAWIAQRRNPLPLLAWLITAIGIYTTLGFRYRLAILLGPLVMLWFVATRKRPNPLIVIPSVLGLVLIAGFVGLTRSYGQGLDLTALEDKTLTDIFLAGFGESVIFLTTGALISITPDSHSFVGLTPLINTLLFPIPAQLLPSKNSAEYLEAAFESIYGPVHGQGAAFMNYGEHYLMGGWPALILGGLILGWLTRKLWIWFQQRQQEPLAQVTYVCAVGYLYVVVSRGYLPQVTMLFCFTVLPLFLLYRWTSRPVTSAPPVTVAPPHAG